MTFESLKDWITVFGLGGLVGTILALIAKYISERKSWEYKHHWAEEKETRGRRQLTDRITYHQPQTTLTREHLGEYIRSGEWPYDEQALRQLLLSLNQGTYEHFLDPEVNRAWEAVISTSVRLAARRAAGVIGEADIWEYNQVRSTWEDACKRSFGPLALHAEDASPGVVSPEKTLEGEGTPKRRRAGGDV